jgi:uncharacterized membrane protein YfcA
MGIKLLRECVPIRVERQQFLSSFPRRHSLCPCLVYLLRVPVHVATATSLFVLMITAFTGSVTHFVTGPLHTGTGRAVALSIGAVVGAQAGAMLSQKIRGK